MLSLFSLLAEEVKKRLRSRKKTHQVRRILVTRGVLGVKRQQEKVCGQEVCTFRHDVLEDSRKIVQDSERLARVIAEAEALRPQDVLASELRAGVLQCLQLKVYANECLLELVKSRADKEGRYCSK